MRSSGSQGSRRQLWIYLAVLALLVAGCGQHTTPGSAPPDAGAGGEGDPGGERAAAEARIAALATAQELGLWIGDLDGDGRPEIALAPAVASQAASRVAHAIRAAAATAPTAATAVVLTHDPGGGLVVAASNAGFDFSQLSLIAQLTVALVAGDVVTLTGVLSRALIGATCSLTITVVEFLAGAAKQALLAQPDLVRLINAVLGTVGFHGDEFMRCLQTEQTLVGCVIIGALADFDVDRHCYQVSDGADPTSCTTPPAQLPLCTKDQAAAGCCNRALVYRVLLSSLRNMSPNAKDPADGPIPTTPKRVVLGSPISEADVATLAQVFPQLAPEVCLFGSLLDTRNPIEVSAQPDQFCAMNVTQEGHVFVGNVRQCIFETDQLVYGEVRGTSELPGISDDPQRLATINRRVGPFVLHTVVDHLRQQVADAIAACSNHDVPPPPGNGAWSVGDPHILSYSGTRIDPQFIGEVLYGADSAGDLVVQGRAAQWSVNPSVATNTAVAARIGADIVAWYADGTVRLNHAPTTFAEGRTQLSSGDLYHHGASYVLVWPDNAQLRVQVSGLIGVQLYVPDARLGRMTGLLASTAGGNLVTRQGTVLAPPVSAATFYNRFLESYRLTQSESLLDYNDALHETTETFTNRQFPFRLFSMSDIPDEDQAAARAVCRSLGVPAEWGAACVVDDVATGNPDIAGALAGAPPPTSAIDVDVTQAPWDGAGATLDVRFPDLATPISTPLVATIGAGVEFPAIQGSALPGKPVIAADIDVGAATIDIHFRQSASVPEAAFNGYVIGLAAPGLPPIRGVAIDPASSADTRAAEVTFDATHVYVHLHGSVTPSSRLLIDLWSAAPPDACGSVPEHQVLNLQCPIGLTMRDVVFASYGLPAGTCGHFAINPGCHATSSEAVIRSQCVGKASCSVPAENSTFNDPCVTVFKHLSAELSCGE